METSTVGITNVEVRMSSPKRTGVGPDHKRMGTLGSMSNVEIRMSKSRRAGIWISTFVLPEEGQAPNQTVPVCRARGTLEKAARNTAMTRNILSEEMLRHPHESRAGTGTQLAKWDVQCRGPANGCSS